MRRSKEKKLLFTWVMSYLLVIVLSGIISVCILAYSMGAQKRELAQNNRTMFEMIQTRTDTMFETAQNIALSFENDMIVQSYLENPSPSVNDSYEIINAITNSGVNTVSYNMISGIYLYVENGDYVLNNLGKYPAYEFYRTYHNSEEFSYQKWYSLMTDSHDKEYINLDYQVGGQNLSSGICMLQTLGTGRNKATLAVMLNTKTIEELIASTWNNIPVGFGIYTGDGQNVFRYGDEKTNAMLTDAVPDKKTSNGYQIYTLKSTITMFSYKIAYPKSVFRGLYIKIYCIFGGMILLLALLALIVTSRYAKENYQSIRRIAQLIEQNVKRKIQMDDKVYVYMEQELRKTFEGHENLREELAEQDEQLKQIFLTNLLTKGGINNDVIAEKMKKFNIKSVSNTFYAAVFYVSDIEDIFFEKNKGSYDDQLHLANFIIENIITELLGERFAVNSNIIDDAVVTIINTPAETNVKDTIREICRKGTDIISKEFGFSFRCCISSAEQGAANLHTAYKNAVYTMDYSSTISSDDILFYDEIETRQTYDSTDLLSVQEKYTGLMQSGNYADAINVLDEVFSRLESGNMSLELLKYKMYALTNLIVENLRSAAKTGDNISQEYIDEKTEVLLNIKTIADLRTEHEKILKELHEQTSLKGADKNVKLIERAQRFICENYSDCNMSVSSIAEHFNLNSLYFSRLFTKYSGRYISDYITQIRLDNVKRLLAQTDDTIAQIAGKTGFYSDVVLIRSFKKNVGTTPGKYRIQMKKE